MIEIKEVIKKFDDIIAVNRVDLTIQETSVFGLLGTNGAGKSTLLRMMAGVIATDEGQIYVDGEPIWQNKNVANKIFYISDDQFYFPNSNPMELAAYYKTYYSDFDEKKFGEFLKKFGLDPERKIKTFSKGMKKQISILLGVCANVKYLLCDETFDGLDPVMRQGIKSIFVQEMEERNFTPIIASHNLRELEDICDSIGLLHQGGIILAKDLIDLKGDFLKVQCVLDEEYDEQLKNEIKIVKMNRHGKLLTMTVRGTEEEITPAIENKNPIYFEMLALTLEEIFISEMEVVGYDIKNLIS